MFAEVNVKLFGPNVLYLDENPPYVFKHRHSSKKTCRAKKFAKKREQKKSKAKTLRGINVPVKEELPFTCTQISNKIRDDVSGEDPLYTPHKELKMETDSEHGDNDFESKLFKCPSRDSCDVKYTDNDKIEDGCFIENNIEGETKHESASESIEDMDFQDESGDEYIQPDEDGEDNDDDKPLILLTKKRVRPQEFSLKGNGRKKKPRTEMSHICRHQCNQKFTPEQRQSMCALFWSLSKEDRIQYIRNHIKTRVLRLNRKKLTNRGNNNCYYLDDGNTECPNLTRVCCKYFEDTLCLSDYKIKKALEGYQPEIEIEVKPLLDQLNEKRNETTPESRIPQFLNAETGDLETVVPKANKTKSATATTTTAKKKWTRRKPGDPLPEHNPKPIKCAERCIYKCHTKFAEDERKKICDAFWSMEYNRRKDFILARVETKDILSETASLFRKTNRPPHKYQTRFFLGSGKNGENNRVCKHFFMNTLSINRMFITDAIDCADKSTGCYTGTDKRGKNTIGNTTAPHRKKMMLDHIGSFPTWMPKSKGKNRYLHHTLSIKRMYDEYKAMCLAKKEKPVSSFLYYTSFHKEFSLYFLKSPEPPQKGKGCLNLNPNISNYTGDEPGGMWLDPQGRELDIKIHNPAHSLMYCNYRLSSNYDVLGPISSCDSIRSTTEATPSTVQMPYLNLNQPLNYANIITSAINSSNVYNSEVLRQESNPNMFDINLTQSHIAGITSLFRTH